MIVAKQNTQEENVRLKYIVVDDQQQQQQHPGNRFLDVCGVYVLISLFFPSVVSLPFAVLHKHAHTHYKYTCICPSAAVLSGPGTVYSASWCLASMPAGSILDLEMMLRSIGEEGATRLRCDHQTAKGN